MNRFRRLDEKVLVAGQIDSNDIAAAAEQGVTTIINNRPDGEEMGQPAGDLIQAATEAAGLAYFHIPVSGGLSAAQADQAAGAIEGAPGQVLMFCRSGTRSTFLWAMARLGRGADASTLVEQAAGAGYDLSPLLSRLGR